MSYSYTITDEGNMKCLIFGHDYNKYDIRTKDNVYFTIRLKCRRCGNTNIFTNVLYEDNRFNDLIRSWLIKQVLERFGA